MYDKKKNWSLPIWNILRNENIFRTIRRKKIGGIKVEIFDWLYWKLIIINHKIKCNKYLSKLENMNHPDRIFSYKKGANLIISLLF